MIYPWLEPVCTTLGTAIARDRVPHALLFTGQPGVGKAALAEHFARQLLCEGSDPAAAPCGRCAGCLQFDAGTHPDFFRVEPVDEATVIKVDQVRELSERLSLSSHRGGYKVALLVPADTMNVNAANSLLKTLEEPSDNTVLLLVSARPAQIPPTIRSRCQRVRVEIPDREVASRWLAGQLAENLAEVYLQLAGGAPLEALRQAQDDMVKRRRQCLESLLGILDGTRSALSVAAEWSKDEELQGVHWLRDWLMDLLRIRMSGQTDAVRSADLKEALARLAPRLDCRVMFGQLDRINGLLRLSASSLNRQMLAEDVLLAWGEQRRGGR